MLERGPVRREADVPRRSTLFDNVQAHGSVVGVNPHLFEEDRGWLAEAAILLDACEREMRLRATDPDEARAPLLTKLDLSLDAIVGERPLLEADDVDPWPLQALRSVQRRDLDATTSSRGEANAAERRACNGHGSTSSAH